MRASRIERPLPRRVLALFVLLALCLTGCFAQGKAGKLRQGKKLMKEYLAGSGRGAAIEECWVDVVRPDADKLIASDYVRGTFRSGGESYEFAVDTVTGQICTSEALPDFYAACVRQVGKKLGLDVTNCPWDCIIWTDAPAWHEQNEEYPDEQTYLGSVIPVDLADMDAYAAQALEDKYIRLRIRLVCPAGALGPDRWTTADTAAWPNVEVELTGADALPTQEDFIKNGPDGLTGPRVELTQEKVEYTPA